MIWKQFISFIYILISTLIENVLKNDIGKDVVLTLIIFPHDIKSAPLIYFTPLPFTILTAYPMHCQSSPLPSPVFIYTLFQPFLPFMYAFFKDTLSHQLWSTPLPHIPPNEWIANKCTLILFYYSLGPSFPLPLVFFGLYEQICNSKIIRLKSV